MSNVIYNIYSQGIFGGIDLLNDTIKCLLVRSTSTYVADKTHDYVSDFTGNGGVEITVASYARQVLTTKVATINDISNRGEFSCDPIDFSTLESGQTVTAYILYKQTGGDDASPADDPLIGYFDTDSGGVLPYALAGGNFVITPHSTGLLRGRQE